MTKLAHIFVTIHLKIVMNSYLVKHKVVVAEVMCGNALVACWSNGTVSRLL